MGILRDDGPISNPDLPAEERLMMLRSIAMTLSPMHPRTWEKIKAEYDEIEATLAAQPNGATP